MATEATATGVSQRRGLARWWQRRRVRRSAWFYAFLTPWVLNFLVFTIGGLAFGLWVTFTNYDGSTALSQVRWVGAKYWGRLFTDDGLLRPFLNTVRFSLIMVPLGNVIALALAALLNQAIRGRNVFRTLYYLPTLVPATAMVVAWKLILNKNGGLLNAFLSLFRRGTAIYWLQPAWQMYAIVVMGLWGVGSGMVIYLAGLQDIPEELREAAKIDGANAWQVFLHVTIPLLTPVIFFQLVMGVIGAMQQWVLPALVSSNLGEPGQGRYTGVNIGANPPEQIRMVVNYALYQMATYQNYSYSIIILWTMSIVLVLLSIVIFKTSRVWVHYEVEQ